MADQLSPIDSRHHKVIPQALLIEPKEVIKFPGPHNQPISVHMKLTNPTHERIAFKVKTTNALFYNVKPIYGIIEPGKMETITIQLKQLIGADGKLMNSNFQPQKHKFLVLSAYAKEGENDPLEIIKVAQENRTELMDTRFRCAFDLPSNLQASESKTAQSVQSFDHVMVTPRNELPNEDNLNGCKADNYQCSNSYDCSPNLIIRSKWNDGCLDGGLFVDDDRSLLYPNEACPTHLTHTKWAIQKDGSIMTEHPNFSPSGMCIECPNSIERCHLIGTACNGRLEQKFDIKIHSNTILDRRNRVRRIFFMIKSRKYPTRCLTAIQNYHRIKIPYFSTYFYRYYYKEEYYYRVWHSSFRLENCRSNDRQLFYINKWQKYEKVDRKLQCKFV